MGTTQVHVKYTIVTPTTSLSSSWCYSLIDVYVGIYATNFVV